MQHTLVFNMPEDAEELEAVMNARKLQSILWDLDQNVFRQYIKYGAESLESEIEGVSAEHIQAVLEWARSKLGELLEQEGVRL